MTPAFFPPVKRLLIKLSGEALMGKKGHGLCPEAVQEIAEALKRLREADLSIALVLGGGNILRGASLATPSSGWDRVAADQMGMLATLINGIALQQVLDGCGVPTHLFCAFSCGLVAPYERHAALSHLDRGDLLLFVGGTGHPYFTTDTAAALRAGEMNVELLVKATTVDGVYDKDPKRHEGAIRYSEITYKKMIDDELKVMDGSAVSLCRDRGIPILVCHKELLYRSDAPRLLARGEVGTLIVQRAPAR